MQGRFIQSRILDLFDERTKALDEVRIDAERAVARSREFIKRGRMLLRKAHLAQLDLLCKRDALQATRLALSAPRTRDQSQSERSPQKLAPQKIVAGPKWALAYVDGRARAFRRGTLPLSVVIGSIEMARGRGVSDAAIAAMLRQSDLVWDSACASVSELPDSARAVSSRPSRLPPLSFNEV